MVIYKITNLLNGKIYIGKRQIDKIKFLNIAYFGSGKYIKNAINKYGINNFMREIIDESNDKKELCLKEKYWIDFYNSKIPYGYNIGDGGEGNNGGQNKGKKWSQEHKNKISKTLKNKYFNKEIKPSFLNKKHTKDSIKKIKEKRSKQILTKESLTKTHDAVRKKWKDPNSKFNTSDKMKEKGKKTSIGLKKYYSNNNKPGNYISREIRECICGCNQTFECKINSKRKYIAAWHHNKKGGFG